MIIKFAKPIMFEEVEYPQLNMDLENMTGQDIIDAGREFNAMGEYAAVLELDKSYQALIAAKASKVPVELIKNLPAKDFVKVTLEVQNFLLQ